MVHRTARQFKCSLNWYALPQPRVVASHWSAAELLHIQSLQLMGNCAAHLLEPILADALDAAEGEVIGLSGILPDAQPLRPLSISPAFLPASLSTSCQALSHATPLSISHVQGQGIEVACLKTSEVCLQPTVAALYRLNEQHRLPCLLSTRAADCITRLLHSASRHQIWAAHPGM